MMKPETEAELAECVACTGEPLQVMGGGTRWLGRSNDGARLVTAGLSGITRYEPGALTLVAQAGTPLQEIEAALEAEGQRLPFEPMDHRALMGTEGESTIGGVVAANVSGPRRIQAGACRDSLIGVRFVDGRGNIVKNGGRVMKNVTGYNLVKLMAGSCGTLGVLTEVAFKVLPAPEARAVVLLDGLSDEQAVSALAAAVRSPFEVSGAAHTPSGVDGHPVTMIRIEGFAQSVAYRAERLTELLANFGEATVETDPDRTEAGWKWVRDVAPFHGRSGDVWRISVKPSDGPRVANAIGAKAILYDWAGGLVWALVGSGTDIRPMLEGIGGYATLVRASDETRKRIATFHPEVAPLATISAGLREQFDPRGILNPGLMG